MTDAKVLAAKTAHILLVDDEVNVLKSLNRLFHSANYIIHVAGNGLEGIEVLKNQTIDLIISDMRMPQMDGAEFLSYAAEHWPDTMRILLTGYADINATITAVNKGKIYNYCTKPWEETELKALVTNALEQKWLREERVQLFETINRQNQQLNELNAGLEIKVEKRTEQLRKSLLKIEHAHDTLNKHYIESVKVFAKIIEMRPGIKSGHSKYIAEMAKQIAIRMNMPANDIKDLVFAGLLLQIGKMSLPDYLLMQSQFAMTGQEKNRFFNHAREGHDLLKAIEPLANAAELLRHQYEFYNGSGYPAGLKADEIPLGTRILTVVRDYITYLDGSITGQIMTTEQVKHRLELKINQYYDPDVVPVFLALLAEIDHNEDRPIVEISWTQLQPGMEIAEVLSNEILYAKDQILSQKMIDDILLIKQHCKNLVIRIRLGHQKSH